MKNKPYTRVAAVIILILMAIMVFTNASFIADTSVLTDGGVLDCPIYMNVAENNNRYIINKSMTQILILNENNEYVGAINGGSESERGFNFVNNFTVDSEGNVYVSDVVSNYDKDKSFRILKFSPSGSYVATVYEKEYETDEEMLYIHSACMALENMDGRIYFAQREFDEIVMYSVADDGSECGEAVVEHTYPYENAGLLVFDIAMNLNDDFIYFTDKKGDIYKADDTGTALIYDGGNYAEDIDFYEVPNCIALSMNGEKLYYTDIGRREVFEIDLATGLSEVIYERDYDTPLDECPIYYRIGIIQSSDEGFAVCSSGDASDYVVYDGETVEHNEKYIVPTRIIAKYIVLVLFMFIVAAVVLMLIVRKLISLLRGENGEMVVTYFLVFISIATIFVVTATILLTNTSRRYNDRVQLNTYYIANIVSQYIDGDTLERIDSPSDYMNEDYITVRNQLHTAFAAIPESMEDISKDMDNTLYCVLYREKNNVVYYTMHLSDDDGVIYPDEYTYEDSDYKLVKDTMEVHSFNGVTTADGRWMFCVAPITNSSGEMVALCEVGINLVSYDEADSRVLRELLICIGSITAAVFLMMSELINLIAIFKKYDRKKKKGLSVDFVRPFAFLIYMADNFTCVIIPLASERMYNAGMMLPEHIAVAMPLAAQAFAAAAMGLFVGHIIRRMGNKKTFILGIILHIVGLTACALTSELYSFTAAMLIVGTGMGLNAVCLNTFVVRNSKGENESSSGFSLLTAGTFAGTNCGIVIGTNISERSSYHVVFAISAAVALVAFFMVLRFYTSDSETTEESTEREHGISFGKFIRDYKVILYFIFALVPYFIFASFVYYFVPIYADAQSVTESEIGLITLAYGLITVYLSNFTTKHIVDRIGAGYSIIAAIAITVASLVVFIIDQSVMSLILVVVIMGVADSFGYPALSVYFLGLKSVSLYKEENAMGIYNIFTGIAETIAPMVIGASLILGEVNGMMVLGGGFIVCAVIFSLSLLGRKKQSVQCIFERL